MAKIGQYLKAITGALAITATALVQANVHTTWATVLVAVAGALAVYQVPNAPRPAGAAVPGQESPAPPAGAPAP